MLARPPAALKGDYTALPGVTDADILTELRDWLKQLAADRPAQQGERPDVEIGLVNRAIVEIERLRSGG